MKPLEWLAVYLPCRVGRTDRRTASMSSAPAKEKKERNFRRSVHAHDDDLAPPPAAAARGRSPDPTFRNRSRSRSRSRSRDRGREPRADAERDRGREASTEVKVDSVHHGRVTSTRDFGCFVRLPGCARDGLLHISQVSDRRIDAEELRELLPVGHEVWVKVTDIKEDGKMGLTAKNVPGHERDALGSGGGGGGEGGGGVARTPRGKPPELFSVHRAVVSNATDFAVFVNLQPSGCSSAPCARLRLCASFHTPDPAPAPRTPHPAPAPRTRYPLPAPAPGGTR